MIDANAWIPYLSNPLVLVGFVALLITWLANTTVRKLDNATGIINRVIRPVLAIGLITIVAGLFLEWNEQSLSKETNSATEQHTEGSQSPAIISNDGDVNVNYSSQSAEKTSRSPSRDLEQSEAP